MERTSDVFPVLPRTWREFDSPTRFSSNSSFKVLSDLGPLYRTIMLGSGQYSER